MIGANCKIGSNVTIRKCIIWDDTEIEDNCTLDDSLICDNVVVRKGCVLESGSRIDRQVIIKQGMVLPRQTLASCRSVVQVAGAGLEFPAAAVDETCFESGAII